MIKKFIRNPISILLVTFCVYITVYCIHAFLLKQTVYGDGRYYFSWLHTFVLDHNINCSNEFNKFNIIEPILYTGLPINKYAIGPSLLWSPFYIMTHLLVRGDGYTFPYQFVVGFSTVLYVITGLILLYRLLTVWTKPLIAAYSVSLIAIATHLLFYGAIDTVNSHGVSFFAATVFLTFFFTKKYFFTGAALGLIALIRPQDILYGILLLPFINLKTITNITIGFVLLFFPQLIIWYIFSGNIFVSPYFMGNEYFSFLTPHFISVLFSFKNGLFIYTPMVCIALVGYLYPWGKQHIYKWTTLAVILLSWYLIASWSTWDQGASYSGRMFVGMLPLIALSLSKLLDKLLQRSLTPLLLILIFLIPLGGINSLLIMYFLLTHG